MAGVGLADGAGSSPGNRRVFARHKSGKHRASGYKATGRHEFDR
jgi:hypothetical protein